MKNGGHDYQLTGNNTYSATGGGGVFLCPDNGAAYSVTGHGNNPSTGQPYTGDETSRFPRSYAINDNAGFNELGSNEGSNGYFWPASYNKGSTLSLLQSPANTIMVCETRINYPDAHPNYLGDRVQPNGTGDGGAGFSSILGHGARSSNFLFFDGHAKAMNAVQTLQQDLWDCYASNADGPGNYPGQQWAIGYANTNPEWNPGY